MIEDGVYIIKQDFFVMFEKMGCKFKNNKLENRPTFCCMKDKEIERNTLIENIQLMESI